MKKTRDQDRTRQLVRVIGALIERLGVQDVKLSYAELNRPREVGMAAEADYLLITSFPANKHDLPSDPQRSDRVG
jgi:hypothetical protein